METFTRYLDAVRFCNKHNLSIAAIQKTGWYKFTVFVGDMFIVGQ